MRITTINEIYGFAKLNDGTEYNLDGMMTTQQIGNFINAVKQVGIQSIGGEDIGDEAHNLVIMKSGKEIKLNSIKKATNFYNKF